MEDSYTWDEMSFLTRWTVDTNTVICLDVPKAFQAGLSSALMQRPSTEFADVYAIHVTILDEFVKIFDMSVWAFRDDLRQIEKVHCSSFNLTAD